MQINNSGEEEPTPQRSSGQTGGEEAWGAAVSALLTGSCVLPVCARGPWQAWSTHTSSQERCSTQLTLSCPLCVNPTCRPNPSSPASSCLTPARRWEVQVPGLLTPPRRRRAHPAIREDVTSVRTPLATNCSTFSRKGLQGSFLRAFYFL